MKQPCLKGRAVLDIKQHYNPRLGHQEGTGKHLQAGSRHMGGRELYSKKVWKSITYRYLTLISHDTILLSVRNLGMERRIWL